jgi:hypothetical protein
MRFILLILIAILTGCSVKTKSVYAVIKTPFVKISDAGFLENGLNYKKLIIYKNATLPVKIYIYKSSICVNGRCIQKKTFIKQLSDDYPINLLDLIIDKKPLKNLGKITKLKDGFLQKNSRFFYLVTKNKVLFKDKLKRIVIMIKDLK